MTTLRGRATWNEPATDAVERARSLSLPLEDDADIDPLLDRISNARFVLLGGRRTGHQSIPSGVAASRSG